MQRRKGVARPKGRNQRIEQRISRIFTKEIVIVRSRSVVFSPNGANF